MIEFKYQKNSDFSFPKASSNIYETALDSLGLAAQQFEKCRVEAEQMLDSLKEELFKKKAEIAKLDIDVHDLDIAEDSDIGDLEDRITALIDYLENIESMIEQLNGLLDEND